MPTSDVIPYLLRQMPRSYGYARIIVDKLDRAALTRPAGVNRPLAIQILAALQDDDPAEQS